MPSQKQLKWSELRVGITVVFALITLAVLVFLMSGTAGFFSSKLTLYTYFSNAEGLKVGAPVRLQGVDIGNVNAIHLVTKRRDLPVQITMRVNARYKSLVQKDTKATIATAGVLGESFIDLDSHQSIQPQVAEGDELASTDTPGIQDVVRASQGTLQNMDTVVRRMDKILSTIESGKGSMGEFINNPQFFDRANSILGQMQTIVGDVSNGKGTIGRFFADDTLYRKFAADVDKLDSMIDDVQQGKGSLGKLVKDESLYKNASETLAKANQLMADINAGHGTLGMLARDEKFARKFNDTIERLNTTLQKIESGNGTAGRFVNDPSVYNNTDQLLTETRGLIKAMREDPKKYLNIHFRIF
ncbi:MAG TPA: MlaD family protein [Candidatus Angelobacter sp.]|nr:MlaD family protein [Candidatus Angelobacter sp.]